LNLDPRFHKLQVFKIWSNLGYVCLGLLSFFSPLSRLIFFSISSFSVYLIEDWVSFLACFLRNSLLVLKMTRLSRVFMFIVLYCVFFTNSLNLYFLLIFSFNIWYDFFKQCILLFCFSFKLVLIFFYCYLFYLRLNFLFVWELSFLIPVW